MSKSKKAVKQIEEQTPAAASLTPHPTDASSKAAMMASAMAHFATLDKSQMAEVLAQIGHEADMIPDGTAEKNQGSLQVKGDAKSVVTQAMKEDVDSLFGSHELSEEFKTTMRTIFEATVNARVIAIEEELREEFEAQLEEQVAEQVDALTENVDRYLSYVAEQFVEKNELAIDSSIRAELTENFLAGLFKLFSEHYCTIPEEQVDVVEALAQEVADLKESLNQQIETNIEMVEVLESFAQKEVFEDVARGLALTQADKLKKLAEGVEFESPEDYKNKLEMIREHHFKTTASGKTQEVPLFEDAEPANTEVVEKADPFVEHFAKAISATAKK